MPDGVVNDGTARNRWAVLVGVRLAAAVGAVFGLVVLARGIDTPRRLLGAAIVLSAMYVMAVVPRALARRWRSR